jgi:ubiquinone/menaquinone biosynthesis C-methylase UbiE
MSFRPGMPPTPTDGLRVLDIGCHDGQRLSNMKGERYGIDVDPVAIDRGKQRYPDVDLRLGRAEELPYPDGFFDLAGSFVALPYTNLCKSLPEARRVLKPGGTLYLTMHDQRMYWKWIIHGIKERAVIRLIDNLIYIYPMSLVYILTGRSYGRFWRRSRFELFCTPRRLRKHLEACGFRVVRIERTPQHFEAEAVAV